MLCTGFFMGIFIATYQVAADSMFLNRMGQHLDKAFLIAGAMGMVTTALFSFFQSRIRFTSIALVSVVLILAFTLGTYYFLEFGNPLWHDYFVFILYVMTGPITAVLLLSFWGVFGRLFNFRQSKRIIGWIDTGQLIAAIITTLVVIPFSSEVVGDTANYLLLCAGSITIVSILLVIIATSFPMVKNDPREMGLTIRKETTWSRLFADKYILLMTFFLLISMITFVLTQYSFQHLVKEQYPDERELTNFTSFFTGAVYGISLIMQTFINHRIITNYGLRISLLVLPVIIAIFASGSILTGSLFGFQKDTSPIGFIYFFLFIALSRLFNWVLRDSMENPVFKLFFIPMENRLRFNIQSKIEGMVNEGSRFLGGVIIFSLAFLPSFTVVHISAIILVLSGAYFFIVNKLHAGYRNKIRLKLESPDLQQQEKLEKGFTKITKSLQDKLLTPYPASAVFSFRLLEKINASRVPSWLNALIRNEDEVIRTFAAEKVNELKGLSVSDRYVIRIDPSRVDQAGKNVLSKAELYQILESGGEISKSRIRMLTRSSNPDERHYAAELLLHTSREENISYLIELLQDPDPKVRSTAISTSVKKNTGEVIHSVIENLSHPYFSNQAMNALVLMGPVTLPQLDAAFYRTGQSTQLLLKLVQAIGRVGGQRAREILWNKIDYPNKVVVSQVLVSLGECGFKAGVSQITRIKYAIETDIADISWNLSAIQEIGGEGFCEEIKASLRYEIQHDIDHIYMLLTMLYDTRSIQLVKENIDTGTPEGITYAIELLDVFLSEQLKQRVIPLLDDLSDGERINRLEYFYPRVKLDSKLVLKFLINRDFTQSNRWTKACVIFQIGIMRIEDFKLDLIAQLFNPDPLVREVSAWALFQINEKEYQFNTKRLGESTKRDLDQLILKSQQMMRFEKVLFFQKIPVFQKVPGVILASIADISQETRLKSGAVVILDQKGNNNFYILVNGVVDYFYKGELRKQFTEGQFIGEMIGSPTYVNTNLLIARTDVIIIALHKDQFYELIADNVKLADQVLEVI